MSIPEEVKTYGDDSPDVPQDNRTPEDIRNAYIPDPNPSVVPPNGGNGSQPYETPGGGFVSPYGREETTDELWARWRRIWDETRNITQEVNNDEPKWWEYDDAYPEDTNKAPTVSGGGPAQTEVTPPLGVQRAETAFQDTVLEEYLAKRGVLKAEQQNYVAGEASKAVRNMSQIAAEGAILGAVSKATKVDWSTASMMSPLGVTGMAMSSLPGLAGTGLYVAFQAGADYTRRLIGAAEELNIFSRGGENFDSLQAGYKYYQMAQGNYVDDIKSSYAYMSASPEERKKLLANAEEQQSKFNERYASLRASGMTHTSAMEQAGREASALDARSKILEKPDIITKKYGKLQFSDAAKEAWENSKGFRYSYLVNPELEKERDKLVDSGMSVEEAAKATEDPIVENTALFIFDPNWVIGLDNLATKFMWKGLAKPAAKTLFKIGTHIPGIKKGLEWATELSARTVANYAARHADDGIRFLRDYADRINVDLTPDFIEQALRNPTEEMLAVATAYDRRALQGLAPYADDVVKAFSKVMDDTGRFDKAAKEAVERIIEAGREPTENLVKETAKEILFEEALHESRRISYAKAINLWADEHPAQSKILKVLKPARQILNGPKGFMVDTWLGLRPSWNVFNYVDNAVKLLMDGVSPFGSLADLTERYAAYSTDAISTYRSAGRLRDTKFWQIGTQSNLDYVEALGGAGPRRALGSFEQGMVKTSVARAEKFSLLRPSTYPGIGKVIEWNSSLAGRIEASMRLRAYYTHFFKKLDREWAVVLRGVEKDLADFAPEISRPIMNELRKVKRPIPDAVNDVLKKFIDPDSRKIISVEMGTSMGDTLTHLPKDMVEGIQSKLSNLGRLSRITTGAVDAKHIDKIFDDVAEEIMGAHRRTVAKGVDSVTSVFPDFPESADELIDVLTGGEDSVESLVKAINDMPAVAKKASATSEQMSVDHWTRIGKMRAEKRSIEEIAQVQDEFLLQRRREYWQKVMKVQEDTVNALAERLDAKLASLGKDAKTPRDILQKYLDAGRAITEVEQKKYEMWRVTMREVYAKSPGDPARDEIFMHTRQETDKLWEETYPTAKARIHDALTEFNKWVGDVGLLDAGEEVAPTPIEKVGNAWWRVEEQLEDVPKSARKTTAPMLEELRKWREHVLNERTAPYSEIPLGEGELSRLREVLGRVVKDARQAVSDAVDYGVEKTNNLLFDYETTQNWMSALGEIFPFVRFPSKNIPLWLDKFSEVPHLVGAVWRVRTAHAEINKDLPDRLKYTVKLPSYLVDPITDALGLNRMDLRFNPWSFVSVFQALPGATAYSQRRLQELFMDESDNQIKRTTNVVATISDELGFGMWPYLDWMLGMYGFLGDDWYPNDAIGTWSPVVNWSMSELFGYGHDYDIDVQMRKRLPTFWNAVFGRTPLAWKELNPNLMQDWLVGRNIEGLIMEMPDPAVATLSEITPVQAKAIVRGLEPGQLTQIESKVLPIFKMSTKEQEDIIPQLSIEEQAVFLNEMDLVAKRKALQERAFTTFIGNMTGFYLQPVDQAEYRARELRMERRRQQESRAPGKVRRDMMSQWREEHPKYGMIQTWRFSEHPWAETAAGREAELWDATVSQYKTKYYDYNRQWKTQYAQAIADTYRENPGDVLRLKKVKAEMRKQKADKIKEMNESLNNELKQRMEAYIEEHPTDRKGAKLLREGWETNVYVGTHLSEKQRGILDKFSKENPDDEDGYNELFLKFYEEAKKNNPPTQKRHVPGLNEGIKMNLEWSPLDNPNYTEDEVREYLIGDLLNELQDNAPSKDDYQDSNTWWLEYNKYLDKLPDLAMESSQAKSQIQALINSGLSEKEAVETVKGWYTADELHKLWRKYDTPWEALEYVYQWHVISEADDQWFNEILPLRKENYALYMLRKNDLEMRFGSQDATKLIRYVMNDYPGKWTAAELQKLYEGVKMPSYFDRMRLRSKGGKAVNSYIHYYYDKLDSDQKRQVREAFGPMFQDQFLTGKADDLSIELRGNWLRNLSQMFGDKLDWTSLPGVDEELNNSGMKELKDYGFPTIESKDLVEFEKAKDLNTEYWNAVALGNEQRQHEIKQNPLYRKWFGDSTPKGYFWDVYYRLVPPATMGSSLRKNPIIASILDKDIRHAAITNADYDRASRIVEAWVKEHGDEIADAGLDPKEYYEVGKLLKEYSSIPREDKDARREYVNSHPLLKKYFDAGKDSSGYRYYKGRTYSRGRGGSRGGGRSQSFSQDYRSTWTALRTKAGQSFPAVLRILLYYWNNNQLPKESEAYLRNLYAELGEGMTFEEWLDMLRRAWGVMGTRRSRSTSSGRGVKPPPTPRYEKRTKGIRR